MAKRARKKISQMSLEAVRHEIERMRQAGDTSSKRYEHLQARKEGLKEIHGREL